jgi:23S rRNA (adenine-N6)-dimethyltransferase
MAGRLRKELLLAQNFIQKPNLVRKLVDASSIGPGDVVYEIGAGTGILTAELARRARRVVALEIDRALVSGLLERFRNHPRVRILQADFLDFRIRDRRYKIFANIPFNRTSAIVRKILCTTPAPQEAYLVMQKEAAEKFSGSPGETRFSLLVKPWFQMRIVRMLRKTDFHPAPRVDSVLLRIQRRHPPLVCEAEAGLYRSFIRYGFEAWRKNLKAAFRSVFSYGQWKRLSAELGFPRDALPSDLTFEQWFGLFVFWKGRMTEKGFRRRVR